MDRRTALFSFAATLGGGATTRLGERLPGPRFGQPSKLSDSQVARLPGTGPIKQIEIRPVPLGGGGFIVGMDQSADGKRFICRTDICNAYVRDIGDHAWRPLFSPATMQKSDYDPLPDMNGKADGQGSAGLRIAPSDKNVLYVSYYGYIWRSADGGKTIRRTAFPQKMMPSNAGGQRLFNRTIDVHPTDPNQILVGTWGEGVWYSRNGGKDPVKLDLPPAPKFPDDHPGIALVLFGQRPNMVYVFVEGVGLFQSTQGAQGPYAAVPDSPKLCASLINGHDDAIYLCAVGEGGHPWRYHPEKGWQALRTDQQMISITVHPTDPKRIAACSAYGYNCFSDDGGATFVNKKVFYDKEQSEVRWIGQLRTFVVAQLLWDPAGGDAVWYANGVGVVKTDVRTGNMIDWSAGIEELIGISGVSPPGGDPILTCWDKPLWRITDVNAYTNVPYFPANPGQEPLVDAISHGMFVDYAGDDPRFLVSTCTVSEMFGVPYGSGYSTDGGQTWLRFTGTSPKGLGYGGCIAASTRQNFIILASNNGYGSYTHDGGKTWDNIRLDGKTDTAQFANAFYVIRKNIAADKTREGVFALVYTTVPPPESVGVNVLGGLWLTKDGGKSWRRMLDGIINKGTRSPHVAEGAQDPRQFWRCQLEYVPGHSGELIYTGYADFDEDRLWWSPDDGASWSELHKSIHAVVSFGFGKPAPGQTRPAFYFYGMVDFTRGLYASFDWFATKPVLISRLPNPQLAAIIWVIGDSNRFGRIWVGTGGAGWMMVDLELAGGGAAA